MVYKTASTYYNICVLLTSEPHYKQEARKVGVLGHPDPGQCCVFVTMPIAEKSLKYQELR